MTFRPSTYSRRTAKGFTLIELIVVVGIIMVLVSIMIMVGRSVMTKGKISQTRAKLLALESLIKEFNVKSGDKVLLIGTDASHPENAGTVYATSNGKAAVENPLNTTTEGSAVAANAIKYNYVNILYRHPATKDKLLAIAGKTPLDVDPDNKLNSRGYLVIRDAWGMPIHYFQVGLEDSTQKWIPGTNVPLTFSSNFAEAPRMYLRSSGPDRMSNFADEKDPVNADDIFSYEAAK